MRNLAILVALVAGCGSSKYVAISNGSDAGEVDAAQSVDVDLAQAPAPDLAWTDLAGGVDIAEEPKDFSTAPADMAQAPPPDMTCPYQIGSACTLNAQCACTTRNTCDGTGLFANGSYMHCCVYKDDPCVTSADCCQRPGVGSGFCAAGKCG